MVNAPDPVAVQRAGRSTLWHRRHRGQFTVRKGARLLQRNSAKSPNRRPVHRTMWKPDRGESLVLADERKTCYKLQHAPSERTESAGELGARRVGAL
jgi:hypothetical protein